MTPNDGGTEAVVDKKPSRDDESEAETGGEPDDGDTLPLDVVFGILKNRRRRLVLRFLSEESETTTLGELAEHIAGIENEKPEESLTPSERKRVYVALYQCHLPKMDDVGIIEFESNRGTVALAGHLDQLGRYLDTEEQPEREWISDYAVVATVGSAVFFTQRVLLPADVLSVAIVSVVVALFADLALEHAFDRGVVLPRWFGRGRGNRAGPDGN